MATIPGALGLVLDDDSGMFRTYERPSIAALTVNMDFRIFHMRFPEGDLLEFPRRPDGILGLIPGYKTMLLVLAMSVAHRLGASQVALGNSRQNFHYRDETLESVKLVEGLYNRVYETEISVLVPFLELEKYEVIRVAAQIPDFPFHLTQSCANPPGPPFKHCGECGSCQQRRVGFLLANVKDPTDYKA